MDRVSGLALAARLFGGSPERTLALLRASWPLAVGQELARRTEVIGVERGTLRVRVPDAGWRKALHRMQPQILRRLRQLTGELAPRRMGLLEGAMAIREALRGAGVAPARVDEVIMGNVLSAGLGQAPAGQAALKGGLPPKVGALTINKVCGSGLKAVMLAAQAIATGDADVVVAGGMESMSNAPYLLPKAREGLRLGHGELVDSVIHDGLWDSFGDIHMGTTAEIVAEKYGITPARQD